MYFHVLNSVQIRDDQYEYKVITDEHFDNEFGIYEAYKDGHLVPYPSRVEGTERWQKARDADAAAAAAAAAATASAANTPSSAPTRGRGRGRGGIKRKAMGDPDAQPTPKRSTRNTDDSLLAPAPMAPAPAKGLLASAAEADLDPEGTPAEDRSPSGTPEPGSFNAAIQSRLPGKQSAREKSPPLPKNIAEPDEYGVRTYNQRPSLRDKAMNSRILAPRMFMFEDHEIGFRDSVNDSSKGHTRAKRGKYLDTPNSNGMHFDHWCSAYDFSSTTPQDFDKATVKRHNVHPKYGIFLPESINEQEGPFPYIMPGKPVVFIANPSGRISHASRGYQKTMNHIRLVDSPWRHKLSASLRRFCKMDDIKPEEITVEDYLPSDEELKKRSLGTAVQELESRPVLTESESDEELQSPDGRDVEEPQPDLSALTDAAAFIDAQEASRAAPAPKKAIKYDAVRDMFMSEPKPQPASPASNGDSVNLNLLAELCNSRPRKPLDWASRDTTYPRPISGHAAAAQPPISNERESSYVPATPGPNYHDLRTATEAPHRPVEPPSIQSFYQPTRHHMGESTVEPSPYAPARQPPHATNEAAPYSGAPHDLASPRQAPRTLSQEYRASHSYPPPSQDHSGYASRNPAHYAPQEHRETPVPQGRPFEHGYEHRRTSAYATESPGYSRSYWAQQAPPGPPTHSTAAHSHQYSLPPPSSSRVPFSHHANAEPLPPLRPPRGRNQSAPEDSLVDPTMRQLSQNSFTPFYSTSSSRPYQNSYPPPESHATFQSRPSERIMPNPQPSGQSYMSSPPPGYAPPSASPTFGTMQMGGPPPLRQNSPETPQGQGMTPNSVFRHRSTPSGSGPPSGSAAADPNSKYRKLQPAPVPAHRAWTNKPELKTIPYDHKDSSGGSAALPNSGPTQIRGWNVNQHRRRNRSDKQDKTEAVNDREDSR